MARQAVRPKSGREIIRLAAPALGSLAAEPLVSLVDTAFVARLGTIPLAALGVDVAILGLAFVAFNFLQYGVTPLVGRLHGEGDDAAIGRATRHSLLLAAVIGAVSSTLIIVFAEPIVDVMATPAAARDSALTYLRIRALSGPAVMIVMAGHGVFRGLLDTKTPFAVSGVVTVMNVGLDALLIFGLGWGLGGAAWASLAAQVSGAGLFLVALRRQGMALVGPVSAPELWALVRVGANLAVRTTALVLTLTIAARVAAARGPAVIAAHQVASQVFLLLGLAIDSLAIAGQSMVAVRLGRGDRPGVDAVSRQLLWWGLAMASVFGAGLWLLRSPVAGVFSSDAETAAIASMFLGWVAVLLVPGGLVFVWDGLYLGASRFRFLAVTTTISAAVALTYLVAAPEWPFGAGNQQVWAGILVLVLVRATFQATDFGRRGSVMTT